MPLCAITEVIDFDPTWKDYDVRRAFRSPVPLAYVVGTNEKMHAGPDVTGSYLIAFPHLASFVLKPDGDCDMEVLPDPAEMQQLLDFGACVGGQADPPITLRMISWIGGPAWRLLDMYARSGFGRLDPAFLKTYYGGDRDELQQRTLSCFKEVEPEN